MVSVLEKARLIKVDGNRRLYDFGKASFCYIQLYSVTKGGRITFAAGECLKDGWLDNAPGGNRRYYSAELELPAECDVFNVEFPPHKGPNPLVRKCLCPEGIEIMPLRYAEITGDTDLQLCRRSYFDGFDDSASEFESSSAALNELWDFCKYSIKATNCFECYIDGDRERLPYEGDTYINQLAHFCCEPRYDKAYHTFKRLTESPTWPVEWRLLMPILLRDLRLYSGFADDPEQWRETLESALYLDQLNEDGLLPERFGVICNKEEVRTIVDWPPVERDECEFGGVMTVPNSYLYAGLLAMHDLYGDECYLTLAQKVKDAMHKLLKKDGVYVDNPESSHSAVHSLIFPVAWGVADESEYAGLSKAIAEKMIPCSVYGAQYLLDACYMCGMAEHALMLMTRRGERSWLGMIDQGSTISMEAWCNSLKPNQDWNHPWGAAPANVIPRRLCGIRPTAPGFARFIVEPQPADLEFFRYRQPTPHGAVTVEYRRAAGTTVTFPNGKKVSFTEKSKNFTINGEDTAL